MNNENGNIPRICVSQSINGCLSAVGGFDIGDIIYIHECESENIIQPNLEQVADRCFTGEQWITEPVKMQLFMKIVIIGMMDIPINNMSNIMYSYKIIDN